IRIDIEQAVASQAAPQTAPLTAPAHGALGSWVLAAVAVLVAAMLATAARRYRRETPRHGTRLRINTSSTDLLAIAVYPDAQALVFVSASDGQPRLWVRSLDSVFAHVLAGTDGAEYPFWSPDSRSIGFFADGKLKRIDIASGTVQTLVNISAARGGTWNSEG